MKAVLLVLATLLVAASAEVYFKETFDDKYAQRWHESSWKKSDGSAADFKLSAGKFYADAEANKGIQTQVDNKFYATYAKLPKAFDNTGKDLVLQYSVKLEQDLDCGGGYIKLIPSSSASKIKSFGGETPYSIMFGPDICGSSTRKVHVILTHKGVNHLIKKEIPAKTDRLTHVYTLVIKPDNTYQVLIDLEEVASGSLEEDWDFLPPKTIKDVNAVKPAEWDDREVIPDPEDVKPEGYDDIPATLVDPEAQQPEDWDEEEDGVWEAPSVPNPEYKGPWVQKTLPNPAYKGPWVAPEIPNPKYAADAKLYEFKGLQFVGFEIWQVKAGTIFDNIIVTDSLEEAKAFAEKTYVALKEAEEAALTKFQEEEAAKIKLSQEAGKQAPAGDEDEGLDEDNDVEEDEEEEEEEEFHDEL